jgi:hypothetical protein
MGRTEHHEIRTNAVLEPLEAKHFLPAINGCALRGVAMPLTKWFAVGLEEELWRRIPYAEQHVRPPSRRSMINYQLAAQQ